MDKTYYTITHEIDLDEDCTIFQLNSVKLTSFGGYASNYVTQSKDKQELVDIANKFGWVDIKERDDEI